MALSKIFFLAPLPSFRATCSIRVGGSRPNSIYRIYTSLTLNLTLLAVKEDNPALLVALT